MLINFVLILTVLLAFCGLLFDGGLLELKKIQMQNAADAAAFGAMHEIERNSTKTTWVSSGRADSSLNGFTNGQDNTTVTLVSPPTSGYFSRSSSAVQATIVQSYKPIFFPGTVNLTAQAVASAPPCAYLLSNISSNPSLALTSSQMSGSCSFYYGASMSVDSGSSNIANAQWVAGSQASSAVGGQVLSAPVFQAPVVADPLSYINSPSFGGSCTSTAAVIKGGAVVLQPGTYCGGFSATNAQVTMNPGLYVITGGMSLTNTTLNGNGITMFLTQGGGSSYGPFVATGGSILNISAPASSSSGGVPGILIFADRSWKNGTQAVYLANSTFKGDGIIYLSNTALVLQGSQVAGTNYFGVVADSAAVSSSTLALSSNYSYLPAGDPFHPNGGLVQ